MEQKLDNYEQIADHISDKITIRDYDNGSSRDTQRDTTPEEKQIIYNLCCSVFGVYRYGGFKNLDPMLSVAEMALHRFLPTANSYDTLYIPVKKALGLW